MSLYLPFYNNIFSWRSPPIIFVSYLFGLLSLIKHCIFLFRFVSDMNPLCLCFCFLLLFGICLQFLFLILSYFTSVVGARVITIPGSADWRVQAYFDLAIDNDIIIFADASRIPDSSSSLCLLLLRLLLINLFFF